MNRHELIEKVKFHWDNPNGVEDLTDFILANFDPKQPATERVSAKEVFLACLSGYIANPDSNIDWPIDKMTKYAAEVAETYNNSLNPESHE